MIGALESQEIAIGCCGVRLHGHLKRAAGLSVKVSAQGERSSRSRGPGEARCRSGEAEIVHIYRAASAVLLERCIESKSRGTGRIRQCSRPISGHGISRGVSISASCPNKNKSGYKHRPNKFHKSPFVTLKRDASSDPARCRDPSYAARNTAI